MSKLKDGANRYVRMDGNIDTNYRKVESLGFKF